MKKTLFFALVIAVLLSISVFAADEADMLIQNAPEFIQGDVMLISDLEEPASQLKYAPDGTPLFGDVDYEKDTFSGALSTLAKAKIVEGFPDGTFRPQNGLTRAEFCKMVNLIFGYKELDKTGFPDVVKEDIHCWFYDVALIAKKAGYIKGYENGDFRGNNNLTREETCTILNRLLKLYAIPLPGMEITDKVSDWAINDVNAVVTNMMMPLEEGNTFRATEIIKRSEVVVVLANLYSARQEEEKKNENNNTGSGSVGGNTGSGNTGSGNTGSGNTGSGNTGSGNTGSGNTGSGNTGSGNTGSGNTGSGNTGSGNTGSGNTGSENTGSGNTGSGNTGSDNTGSGNTGSGNTGDDNTGDNNTGDDNTGDDNTGDDNTGSGNTGDNNTGDDNTGDDNTGDDNTGDDNTGDGEDEMTPEEIEEIVGHIETAREVIDGAKGLKSEEREIKKLLLKVFDKAIEDGNNGVSITPEYTREAYDDIIQEAVDKHYAMSEDDRGEFINKLMNLASKLDDTTYDILFEYFPLEYFI